MCKNYEIDTCSRLEGDIFWHIPSASMRATRLACIMFGCATVPASGFTTGAGGRFATSIPRRTHSRRDHEIHRRRRADTIDTRMMALDPATVHSVSEHLSVLSTAGVDETWLSHVLHGEQGDCIFVKNVPPSSLELRADLCRPSSVSRAVWSLVDEKINRNINQDGHRNFMS